MTTTTLLVITGPPGTGKSTLAETIAPDLGASVVGHDWAMAALKTYPPIWQTMEDMNFETFRSVGWSIMWSFARAQLQHGRSVILDGVAREPEVEGSRQLAQKLGVRSLVVLTEIIDPDLHRSRIDGRSRGIPNWAELSWEEVVVFRGRWEPPEDVDLVLDASNDVATNTQMLRQVALDSVS